MSWGCSSVAEYLSYMPEALGSTASTRGGKQQILGLITKTVLPLIYAKNKNQLSFSNLKSEAKQTEFNTIL